VFVFLEGTRTLDGRITDPKLGAALIAQAKTPLLRSVYGDEGILKKRLCVPQPITVPDWSSN